MIKIVGFKADEQDTLDKKSRMRRLLKLVHPKMLLMLIEVRLMVNHLIQKTQRRLMVDSILIVFCRFIFFVSHYLYYCMAWPTSYLYLDYLFHGRGIFTAVTVVAALGMGLHVRSHPSPSFIYLCLD